MTTAKKLTSGTERPNVIGLNAHACVVTGWSKLAERLKDYFGQDQISVRNHLADILWEKDCRIFIVDTKVNDIGIWPAPLLLEPGKRNKPWLFLLADPVDASFVSTPLANCAFFKRRIGALDAVVSYVRKYLDPEARKRIEKVEYLKDARTFIIRMENRRIYALKVDDLREADASNVIRWTIGMGRNYFRVTQESGNFFEVPWDEILYYCEPEYEYYKETQKSINDDSRASRIGKRVRELRIRRGFSVTELADRSGMKRPNLSRLEYGRHIPSLETIERLASALEAPVAELIART